MKTVTATEAVRDFSALLSLVEHGQSVQIVQHGRPVARITPDCGFMSGSKAAALFREHKPDAEAADAIAIHLRKAKDEEDDALAHRCRRLYRRPPASSKTSRAWAWNAKTLLHKIAGGCF